MTAASVKLTSASTADASRCFAGTLDPALALKAALTSRATLDHAVGIIMSRSETSADEVFVRLRIMSQHEHIKVSVVAAQLVEKAGRQRALAYLVPLKEYLSTLWNRERTL